MLLSTSHAIIVSGENYAQEAIKSAIRKGSSKRKKKHANRPSVHRETSHRRHGQELSDDAFLQRDAVVKTLISHCQISAPLLKLFPIDWQRAIVGNILTLATAVVSDFADAYYRGRLRIIDGLDQMSLKQPLGGGILRSQVGNLIARVVLTLIDEVLSGARLDLWSSQANGPISNHSYQRRRR
eukprot:scaffold2000_cov124-Alexandrium_tamarense.AAC.2